VEKYLNEFGVRAFVIEQLAEVFRLLLYYSPA
jgi:hypothetical protein